MDTSVVDIATVDAPPTFTVEGNVSSRTRPGVSGLRVEIVDKNAGTDGNVHLSEATTKECGHYRATFDIIDLQQRGKRKPDLQARVFLRDTLLAVSEVRYNASQRETLDVPISDAASARLPSEYETLTADLAKHFDGGLGSLQEAGGRQDITYLGNKTGWDARAVAIAALAEKFSAATVDANGETAIPPALLYALLRAGVRADESAIYHTKVAAVEAIWRQGIAEGVIPAGLAGSLPAALAAFARLAAQRMLDAPALVGVSSLKEMLSLSLGEDANQHQKFVDLFVAHGADVEAFWHLVEREFPAQADRLKLHAQLGAVTLYNAPLIRKLHAEHSLDGALSLVDAGYYRAERWQALIGDDRIPPEIPGNNPAEQRAGYAAILAAHVRLGFPTAVVARMVKSGETPLSDARSTDGNPEVNRSDQTPGEPPPYKVGLRDEVHAHLSALEGKFNIGLQPIEQYVQQNSLEMPPDVRREITRIQRVHQISPSDTAMNALLEHGVESAYAVVGHDRDTFVHTFKDRVGGEEDASLIYAKAQQVHTAVVNIATSYVLAKGAPPVGLKGDADRANYLDLAPNVPTQASAAASDVIAYPTLEGLFGEMDYCACEHCRSILSPAAYLVDLLQFLDRDRTTWDAFLAQWTRERGAPYPFINQTAWVNAGQPPAASTAITPYDVLIRRRGDLPHVPLTCGNTNTPVPYLDLVNETLEFLVMNNSLVDYKGHDTNDSASPEELLASPQVGVGDVTWVNTYKKLAGELFPPPLPFNRRLESLRRYFDKFGSSLPRAMEVIRKNDNLERPPAPPDSPLYGWRDILMETLRLSRDEYRILTDRTLTVRQLYGYPPAATGEAAVPAELWNVQLFTRRVGISYDELIEIVQTRFVNPSAALIPKVERLGVTFRRLKELKDNASTGQAWLALLPSPLPDASYYGGDIRAWVKNEANFARIMSLITLANPIASDDACSFDNLEFRYANPDINANKVRPIEFVRLIRFIRLWKKLGWTIDQTDKAITAHYPELQLPTGADDAANLQKLDAGFLDLLPRLGMVESLMDTLEMSRDSDLLPFLACFALIDTAGPMSLYRQLFLSPSFLERYPVFADNGFGEFPSRTEPLALYAEALRAAFLLTGDEFAQIATDLRFDATTTLTLKNMTEVFRRGWLARQLRISVRELLLLVRLTGLDPFSAPDPPDAGRQPPRARPPILTFIELINGLRAASLKPEQVLSLLWNEDMGGTSAPPTRDTLDLARTLRAALSAIESEFAIADDPDGRIARTKMGLVYGDDATDAFFGLLERKTVSDVPYTQPQASLDPAVVIAASGHINYDNLRKRLSYAGAMSDPIRTALKAVPGVSGDFNNAVDALHAKSRAFFVRYPELLPPHDAYAASTATVEEKRVQLLATFLPELERQRKRQEVLETISAAVKIDRAFVSALLDDLRVLEATTRASIEARFFFRATATGSVDLVMPATADLAYADPGGRKLPSNPQAPADPVSGIWTGSFVAPDSGSYTFAIKADVGATVALEIQGKAIALSLTSGVWTSPAVPDLRAGWQYAFSLKVEKVKRTLEVSWKRDSLSLGVLPARYPRDSRALDDMLTPEKQGLSAQFFWSDTATGLAAAASDAEANLSYSATGANKLPPNGLDAAKPISGIWSGYVEPPENGKYHFRIETDAGATVALSRDGRSEELVLAGNVWTTKTPVELRAGTLHAVTLRVDKLKSELRVLWQTTGSGRQVIPSRSLYSERLTARLRTTYVRFLKAVTLAMDLELRAGELAHFAMLDAHKINERGWLNSLSVDGKPSGDVPVRLFQAFGALLAFAGVKKSLAPDDERLIAILRDPAAATQNADSLLYALTGWEQGSLDAFLSHFGKARTDLAQIETFRRVYDAFALLKQVRVPVPTLISVTHNRSVLDDRAFLDERAFLSALRARHHASDWLTLLKSINDDMRVLQRTAMVAYILHRMRSDPKTKHIDTTEKLFEFLLMDVQMDACMQTSRIRHALSSVQLFTERCLMNLEPQVAAPAIKAKEWEWMKRYRVWEANRKLFLYPENWLEPELRDDASPFFKETMTELLQSDITDDRAAVALGNYLSKLEEIARLEPCSIYYAENNAGDPDDDVAHVVARTTGASRRYFWRRRAADSWTPWEHINLDIQDSPVVPMVWKGRLFLFWLRIVKEPEAVTLPGGQLLSQLKTNQLPTEIRLMAKAALCWSEYGNGKWQPPKMSDVNRSLRLGQCSDGSVFGLLVEDEGSNLQLTVTLDGTMRSAFILRNTHSLPDTEVPVAQRFAIGRRLETALPDMTNLFAVTYIQNNPHLTRRVLQTTFADRTLQPHNPLNNWRAAPFFYADDRYVFYVSTVERTPIVPPPTPPPPPPPDPPPGDICDDPYPPPFCHFAPNMIHEISLKGSIPFGGKWIRRSGAPSDVLT